MENNIMRVAVSQFATSSNLQENLASCIRMINETAECKPSLIVLPEFCNTLFCHSSLGNEQISYADHNQAWNEALTLDGPFLQAIAEQAIKHDCYIVINVTLRRDPSRDTENSQQYRSVKSNISVTSCLFSPLGKLIYQADKQRLTGREKDFFTCGSKLSEVITAPFGKLGLLAGSDSLTFAASRELALNDAQLLCNSINTFALDQSYLHDPARASENKVFLATANKVGSLIPTIKPAEEAQKELLQTQTSPEKEQDFFEENLLDEDITAESMFVGIGQSQITSPDGKVLARVASNEEGFVFADITLTEARLNSHYRPDGTELSKQRRPELYQSKGVAVNLAAKQEPLPAHLPLHNSGVPQTANVAIFATYRSNEQAIEDVCHYIENNLSDIIQLPELFFLGDKTITNNAEQLTQIGYLSTALINQISSVLRPFQYVCTSLVIEGMHQAVLISENGLVASQKQLHFCQRYRWTDLGDELNIIELPLEQGNIILAMLTGDDASIPEIVNVAALSGIHVLLVPFDIQEPSEVKYNLLSRAAEHRICIVAASREKSFIDDLSTEDLLISEINVFSKNKNKVQKSTGLIANLTLDLTSDLTLVSQRKSRKFTGYINQPLVKYQFGKITKSLVHPIAACNKVMEANK